MTDFGRCMSCSGTDLNLGRVVQGEEAMAEHVDRLLHTAPGQLIDDEEWGMDLVAELNNDLSPAEIAQLPRKVENALKRDERIPDATVRGTWIPTEQTLKLDMTIYLASGPFELTGTATALGLTVERMRR